MTQKDQPEGFDGTNAKLVKAQWDATQYKAVALILLVAVAPPVGAAVMLFLVWRHIFQNWSE